MPEAMGEDAYRGKPRQCHPPQYILDALARSKEVIARASTRGRETIHSRAIAIIADGATNVENKLTSLKQLLSAVTTVGSEMEYLFANPELENAILLLSTEDRDDILAALKQAVDNPPE